MSDESEVVREVLTRLVNSIQAKDLVTYRELVATDLTCFEPETQGNRVDGIDFHIFLTEQQASAKCHHLEIVDPVIRVYGGIAYAAYTLLVSRVDNDVFSVNAMNETRVFSKASGRWQMVHFHRSRPTRPEAA